MCMFFCEVSGERVNRGVQPGVEVPCITSFMAADLTKRKDSFTLD